MPEPKMVKQEKLDPLFVIFEKHLMDFSDDQLDKRTFALGVIQEYQRFLSRKNITIPEHLQRHVFEELEQQISTMLVKKIYGCFNVKEFQEKAGKEAQARVQARYKKLKAG